MPRPSTLIPPGDDDADVTRNAAGKVDDLVLDAIAARLQIVGPELKDFPRNAGQRLLPTRRLLIDGATPIGAERIGKAVDLDLVEAVPHRALDDGRREPDLFVLGQSGRLAELLDQHPLLGIGSCQVSQVLIGLLGLPDRSLALIFLGRWYQDIDVLGHDIPLPAVPAANLG